MSLVRHVKGLDIFPIRNMVFYRSSMPIGYPWNQHFYPGFSDPIEILPRNLDNPKTAISSKKEHLVLQQWRHSSRYLFSHKASSNSAYAMDPYFWWLFAYRPSIFPHTLILCELYEISRFWLKMNDIFIIMCVIRSEIDHFKRAKDQFKCFKNVHS